MIKENKSQKHVEFAPNQTLIYLAFGIQNTNIINTKRLVIVCVCLQNKLITVTPETKVLKAMQLMTGAIS